MRSPLKWALAWVPMVALAIANGAARDLGYGPHVGELAAHQISTVAALVLLGLYIRFAVRLLKPASRGQAAAIGAMWLVMTLAFEFLFGHYVADRSWRELLDNYDVLAGRLWPLIPLWVAVAPALFYRVPR